MPAKFTPMIYVAVLCLCGCPLGSPNDHYRPHGHLDITIDVSPTDDAIVFNASGRGGRDLFLLRLADVKVLRVADTPEYEVAPSFSPDGKRIVYAAGTPGDRADHIFTIARDGSSKTQLTDADANDTSPRFSPDGSMIVFARDKTYVWGGLAANWENGGVICIVDADGTNERQLTADEVFAFDPQFSEDGKSVFYFTTDGISSVAIDGAAKPNKMGASAGMHGEFSPNGQQLVYSDGKYAHDHELFVANIDGNNKSQLTKSENGCFHPVFTWSGDRIYFLVEEWPQGPTGVPKSSIWTVTSDGTEQEQVTDLLLFDAPMDWKPKPSP